MTTQAWLDFFKKKASGNCVNSDSCGPELKSVKASIGFCRAVQIGQLVHGSRSTMYVTIQTSTPPHYPNNPLYLLALITFEDWRDLTSYLAISRTAATPAISVIFPRPTQHECIAFRKHHFHLAADVWKSCFKASPHFEYATSKRPALVMRIVPKSLSSLLCLPTLLRGSLVALPMNWQGKNDDLYDYQLAFCAKFGIEIKSDPGPNGIQHLPDRQLSSAGRMQTPRH
ncbi:hypothetical protein BDZ45DRAFT_699944 [Acephala macrosclerotiorum]|nr:hypothetical protein BDZ45DRAFT_699944 [Acephala macrosclerotiorum]